MPDTSLIKISDLHQGVFGSTARPGGNYRTSWIMMLRRKKTKCKLPRGFGSFSGKTV